MRRGYSIAFPADMGPSDTSAAIMPTWCDTAFSLHEFGHIFKFSVHRIVQTLLTTHTVRLAAVAFVSMRIQANVPYE
jgi:hypothetical protein